MLGEALGWKYNHTQGIKTKNEMIIRWPASLGVKPTDAELNVILTEYQTHLTEVENEQQQRVDDIGDNLPNWNQVSASIDNATSVAGLKIIVKKLARVVYWLAKNKKD